MVCTSSTSLQKLLQKVEAIKRMRYLPKKVKEQIYYKTVIPCITYCIAVWGNRSPALFDKVENIHARTARVIHKLPSEFSNERSLAMANCQPLSYIYKRRILSVMHQIYYDNTQSDIKNLFVKKRTNCQPLSYIYKTRILSVMHQIYKSGQVCTL